LSSPLICNDLGEDGKSPLTWGDVDREPPLCCGILELVVDAPLLGKAGSIGSDMKSLMPLRLILEGKNSRAWILGGSRET